MGHEPSGTKVWILYRSYHMVSCNFILELHGGANIEIIQTIEGECHLLKLYINEFQLKKSGSSKYLTIAFQEGCKTPQ